jgi:hypothetical protein
MEYRIKDLKETRLKFRDLTDKNVTKNTADAQANGRRKAFIQYSKFENPAILHE